MLTMRTIIFVSLLCLLVSCEKCYVCEQTIESDWNTDDPVLDATLSSELEFEIEECFTKSQMEDYEMDNTSSETTLVSGGSYTISSKMECRRDFLGKFK